MKEQITSRHNALIVRLRKLSASRARRREEGVFLCEGPKLVGEAVKWGAGVETLLVSRPDLVLPDLPAGTRVVEVPEDVLRSVSDVETPQGVLAVCALPDLRPPQALRPGRYLILDGIQDPGNLGTIWRTADAFGASGLLLVHNCADPFIAKTVRATMGAAFRLPVWETTLEEAALLLEQAGVPLYTTSLGPGTVDIRALDLTRAAVVIGSEGRGVSPEALALCRQTFRIPMESRCESLNAAVAAAVTLWEMARQDG